MNGTNVLAGDTISEAMKRKHVVPDDGCKHVMSADCWCQPEPMEDCPLIYVHVPHASGASAALQ